MHNILLYRPISKSDLDGICQRYPQCTFVQTTDASQLNAHLEEAEVVLGNIPADLLVKAPRLRWVQIVSAGFDEYASLKNAHNAEGAPVTLTTARGVHSPFLAQHVLMAMLMFSRGQLHFEQCRHERQWNRSPAIPFNLAGQTVGFVGLGGIARELMRFLPTLGLRATAVRHTPAPQQGLEWVGNINDLDRLLAQSQHIVMGLPLTDSTRNLINAHRVALMPKGAFFYNVARGGLVDESALLKRLHDRSLGGAALDVFEQEPLPDDSPWWSAPRTLITPHIAGHHRNLGDATLALFQRNLDHFLANEPLINPANFTRGY